MKRGLHMTNPNRQRALLAAQKIRQQSNPVPIGPNDKVPALTAEQRRELYAPKPAASAPEHLRPNNWVAAWRMIERTTHITTAITGALFAGLVIGESKKSVRQ